MAKINGNEVTSLIIKNASASILGTLAVADSGGIDTGQVTVSEATTSLELFTASKLNITHILLVADQTASGQSVRGLHAAYHDSAVNFALTTGSGGTGTSAYITYDGTNSSFSVDEETGLIWSYNGATDANGTARLVPGTYTYYAW